MRSTPRGVVPDMPLNFALSHHWGLGRAPRHCASLASLRCSQTPGARHGPWHAWLGWHLATTWVGHFPWHFSLTGPFTLPLYTFILLSAADGAEQACY